QRLGHSGKARQPLSSTRSRNDPKLYFRLTDLSRWRRYPVMTGHSEFESPAECGSVNGAHNRLGTIFDLEQQGEQTGTTALFARYNLAKLLDVRPDDERPAGSDQHNGLDRSIGLHRGNRVADSLPNTAAQGVDWGIVNCNEGDVPLSGQ